MERKVFSFFDYGNDITIPTLKFLIEGLSKEEEGLGLVSGIDPKTKILSLCFLEFIIPENKKIFILDLSKEVESYGGGSATAIFIQSQFEQTLKQFYDDVEIVILVEGNIGLQP